MKAILFPLCLSVLGLNEAKQSTSLSADKLSKMPVKEVTVFKDGHAFVLHEGEMPTNERGEVVLDSLPSPVLGTFWPYSNHPRFKLRSVVAGARKVKSEKASLNLVEMFAGNLGAEGFVTEVNGNKYSATILSLPTREDPSQPERSLPIRSNYVVLKTGEGFKTIAMERIQDFTFKNSPNPNFNQEEFRNVLSLKFDFSESVAPKSIPVGISYLQKGIRWIPHYRIVLDGNGQASIQLQATLLNELTDLDQVNINLVIGVPSFFFKGTADPIGLQNVVAQLSQYFQTDSYTGNALSNAIQTQALRMGEYQVRETAPSSSSLASDIPEGATQEDLFMFTLKNMSLKQGERAVVPVAEFSISYRDMYSLDLQVTPPMEFHNSMRTAQSDEIAKLLRNPKVMHKLCLQNSSKFPLTTAPALILRDGKVLAQGLMHYAAVGASTELDITSAVEVPVRKVELETKRLQNALTVNRENYDRVDFSGTVKLSNYKDKSVDLEITRYVIGNAESVSHDGKIEKINPAENDDFLAPVKNNQYWNYYNWPLWWSRVNSVSKISWKVTLEPNKSVELNYGWHYFYRY